MKFYDVDDIFTYGKYEGETLAEVFEKDPKYIKYCQENIDEFYVSPNVLNDLKTISRDNRLMNANLDEMSDDELQEFMKDMNDIDEFDESKLEDDFDWEKGEDIFADDEEDIFGKEEYLDDSEFDEPYDDPYSDSYDDRY